MVSKRSLIASVLALGLVACAPAAAPKAAIGGPFQLVDQNGKPQTEALLKGKWSAVYFGFTYCPDVCPTTLQALGEAKRLLGGKGRDFQVVLISVDPERDKPALMKAYLDNAAFPQGAVGLTGTLDQVGSAAKAYRVYFKKVGTGDNYTVDHVAYAYLMNPKGEFVRIIDNTASPDDIAYMVREAMAGRPDARPPTSGPKPPQG
jgi:protein SCO1/2